ncbi:MAG: diphthamide synthesis protein [Candidatus Woesearchaeota archaeon]
MFDLELNRIIKQIKTDDAKNVLVQLPDGLKSRSEEIIEKIETETDADVFIWLGGCFGACDLPLGTEETGIDLIISFGHNKFHKTYW